MKAQSSRLRQITVMALCLATLLQGCTLSLFQFNAPTLPSATTNTPDPAIPTVTPHPMAQTNFITTLPEPLQAGETLTIAVLDEVTGLPVNPTTYPMAARDPLTYTATLPLPYNTVVKYRYIKRTSAGQVVEDTTKGTSIRYRLYYAIGPADVTDIVADWGDKSYARPTGSIQGRVFNTDTGSPLPNVMVSAGGIQYLTDSTGHFELSGVPVGTHNLVAYSLDGMYRTFQQGAAVVDGQVTQADMRLAPARLVNITFIVSTPAETVPGAPVRIAGNILQLGNTFADLEGSLSVAPERMPTLNLQADGKYAVSISLPVGAHIQYKYTLGDGFWNAEHKKSGEWVLRDFIVPEQDATFQDSVETWLAGNSSPILFEVNVPSTTPSGDIIYIQFNPYGWTESIPMWPLGNNRWAYQLYGPINTLGSFGYRYCRNGQCGSADDAQTSAANTSGRQAITSITAQDIQDTVNAWKWFENPEPGTLVGAAIVARANGFMAGVEFQPTFRPNWSYFIPQALINAQAIGSNQIVFSPTWTYSSVNPLTFATAPGQDPLWIDSAIMLSQAKTLGLNTAIFPQANFANVSSATFWQSAPRDAQWWQTWFARYRAFAIHYADLATQSGAGTLILGGDSIMPALPGGKLADGSSSNTPADAEAQWKSIIAEVRTHFGGKVYWALPFVESGLDTPFTFLQDVDGIYLLWSAKLATSQTATKTDYANEAGRLLDNEVAPLATVLNKPIILAVSYPSAAGAASGCIPDAGSCLDWSLLSRPNPDYASVSLSLQTQSDLYEALLIAINSRAWISGFVSRGYYPPAALQDKSTSVHNKPAADILWYWYPRMLGKIQ